MPFGGNDAGDRGENPCPRGTTASFEIEVRRAFFPNAGAVIDDSGLLLSTRVTDGAHDGQSRRGTNNARAWMH